MKSKNSNCQVKELKGFSKFIYWAILVKVSHTLVILRYTQNLLRKGSSWVTCCSALRPDVYSALVDMAELEAGVRDKWMFLGEKITKVCRIVAYRADVLTNVT
jgi:hypothetical protein